MHIQIKDITSWPFHDHHKKNIIKANDLTFEDVYATFRSLPNKNIAWLRAAFVSIFFLHKPAKERGSTYDDPDMTVQTLPFGKHN